MTSIFKSQISNTKFAILIASFALSGCISTAPLQSNYGQQSSAPTEVSHETPAPKSLVRPATESDLDAIEVLAQQKFHQYEKYQPLYYRVAADSRERHLAYLSEELKAGHQIMLVHETTSESAAKIDGFLMAKIVVPPPIYDQKLITCLVDDFVVSRPSDWPTIGTELLDEVNKISHTHGAIQTVVVCGHLDEPKRHFLRTRDMTISAEWYTQPQTP